MNTKPKVDSSRAFTIVELVLVIVVIGILAGITTIAWSGWRQNAAKSEVKSDLLTVASAMESAKNFGSGYPSSPTC
jgi:prepilin-type N-terminal cleavage/methylation domain-containing protein